MVLGTALPRSCVDQKTITVARSKVGLLATSTAIWSTLIRVQNTVVASPTVTSRPMMSNAALQGAVPVGVGVRKVPALA